MYTHGHIEVTKLLVDNDVSLSNALFHFPFTDRVMDVLQYVPVSDNCWSYVLFVVGVMFCLLLPFSVVIIINGH